MPIINIKKKCCRKLEQLQIILSTPGALMARMRYGCYLEMYRMVYSLFLMGLKPKSILDIGAHYGQFSKSASLVFPSADIYAFEPLNSCYGKLCGLKNFVKNFECYNTAIGDIDGETVMNRSSRDYSSSLLTMSKLHKKAFPETGVVVSEKIKISKLDSWRAGKKIERPLLMKIDVQGYEDFVLRGAGETIEETDFIICEMSFKQLYEKQALFHELYETLIRSGFVYRGHLSELRNPDTTELLQVDGLFARER